MGISRPTSRSWRIAIIHQEARTDCRLRLAGSLRGWRSTRAWIGMSADLRCLSHPTGSSWRPGAGWTAPRFHQVIGELPELVAGGVGHGCACAPGVGCAAVADASRCVQLSIIRTCTPACVRLARNGCEPLRSLCQWPMSARRPHDTALDSTMPRVSRFGNRDTAYKLATAAGRFVVRCQPRPKACQGLRCPPVGAAEDSHEGGN